MSTTYGSSGIINNLVMCLDAGNAKSFPGTGSVWYDISGNNKHATLINSPIYTSTAAGYFTLNGSSQYALITNYTDINFNNSTVVYIAYLDATPNARNTIFSQYYGGTGSQFEWSDAGGIRSNYRQETASTQENTAAGGTLEITNNTIYHVCVTYSPGGVISHYKNGILLGTTINNSQNNINGIDDINIGRNPAAGLYFDGRVYYCAIYNRALMSSEITTHFNSVRRRYEI